jgi:hypothetical protein
MSGRQLVLQRQNDPVCADNKLLLHLEQTAVETAQGSISCVTTDNLTTPNRHYLFLNKMK